MTNEEMAERLVETESRSKSNTHRLDAVEKNQEALAELTASVRALATDQGNLKQDVSEIKGDVKSLMGKPGRRWDSMVDKLLYAAAAAVIVWLLSGAPGLN